MIRLEKNLNALVVIILSAVLLGGYGVQFFAKEEPCPLCMLQRLSMIGVASGLMLNVRFGILMTHYALALFSSLIGASVALRHISLHVCSTPFGMGVLGFSLYTWSFIVFACCIAAVALLLCLYRPEDSAEEKLIFTPWTWTAFTLIFLLTVANVFTTYLQCGFGICDD